MSLPEKPLPENNTAGVVATFANHTGAEDAIKKLSDFGFEIEHLSVIGKGYHVDEHVTGFYNKGDRIWFWGSRGAFWGGLWSLFFGGLFMTVPVIGPVVALGYVATIIIGAVEGAILVGGVSAISAALYSIGIPRDSVLQYETAIAADDFLVVAHDTPERIESAREILTAAGAGSVNVHHGLHAVAIKQAA
jgi:hypothetical protein